MKLRETYYLSVTMFVSFALFTTLINIIFVFKVEFMSYNSENLEYITQTTFVKYIQCKKIFIHENQFSNSYAGYAPETYASHRLCGKTNNTTAVQLQSTERFQRSIHNTASQHLDGLLGSFLQPDITSVSVLRHLMYQHNSERQENFLQGQNCFKRS